MANGPLPLSCFCLVFGSTPGIFLVRKKKIRKLVVEVGGWNEGSVGCFDFFGFDCFCFFLVMIFKCWSKLLASSLSYIKHNMQETPGTWTNRYPSKREALSNTHFFQRALHPLNFRKGTIISNSKKVEKISYFISEPSKCFPDLLATVLTPGSFNVGCCLFSPFQKKGLYFGVAMGFATKNKQHEKKKKLIWATFQWFFWGGEQWSSKTPRWHSIFLFWFMTGSLFPWLLRSQKITGFSMASCIPPCHPVTGPGFWGVLLTYRQM